MKIAKHPSIESNSICRILPYSIRWYRGGPLFLTVLDESMGCVLGQHDETGKKEHAIYYLSKRFTGCEQRYSMLE